MSFTSYERLSSYSWCRAKIHPIIFSIHTIWISLKEMRKKNVFIWISFRPCACLISCLSWLSCYLQYPDTMFSSCNTMKTCKMLPVTWVKEWVKREINIIVLKPWKPSGVLPLQSELHLTSLLTTRNCTLKMQIKFLYPFGILAVYAGWEDLKINHLHSAENFFPSNFHSLYSFLTLFRLFFHFFAVLQALKCLNLLSDWCASMI